MLVFEKVNELRSFLDAERSAGKSIGFVPTMGALHEGHGSLISQARKENDIVIASVFVNPRQFNNPDDLLKYPRTTESDIQLLTELHCDVLFLPSVEEIYAQDYIPPVLDLGILDTVMEGALRPGHFNGVVQVVYRLFDLIHPTRAYFGLKDFQQVAVINYMVKTLKIGVEIVACPIMRDNKGLALSSRNMRLSGLQKEEALLISRTLFDAAEYAKDHTPSETKEHALDFFSKGRMNLEYFEIVDPVTLESIDEWVPGAIACIVAYAGDVRLIDNYPMK